MIAIIDTLGALIGWFLFMCAAFGVIGFLWAIYDTWVDRRK